MRFAKAEDFYREAGPFLLQRETEHCLVLGICSELIRYPERIEHQPYLATVVERGEVVAAALMTPPHNLLLSHCADPEALVPIADDLYGRGVALPGVNGAAPLSKAFAQLWQARTGQSYELGMALRIYRLDKVKPVFGVPGRLRRASEADRELLLAWIAAFSEAVGEGRDPRDTERTVERFLSSETRGLYLWEDGHPVSMAGYGGPTPHGMRVSAVYTPPQYRRRGYASACVAAVSQLLLDSGRQFCFLFTDLANPTSNHIYQEVGYRPACDVDVYRFRSAGDGA